jgi:hypothetical protein
MLPQDKELWILFLLSPPPPPQPTTTTKTTLSLLPPSIRIKIIGIFYGIERKN